MFFPTAGIDVSAAYSQQRPNTTPGGVNVRAFEPLTNRMRGAQRSGLSKYLATRPAAQPLQDLGTVVTMSGAVQTSGSGRAIYLVAVAGGNVYCTLAGSSVWTAATNVTKNATPLISGGVVRSAENNQRLWFADGTNWCYFDPADLSVHTWTASAGALPTDDAGNAPRLICTWRGRTVVSGHLKDPQNVFLSAVGDPTDWDYSPLSTTPTQAVALNASPLGLVGDNVTSLVPSTDDLLILGGDHTLWMMRGDPNLGGQIDLLSDAIGMAWGIPWCKGPDGTVYFVSNRCGIYAFQPNLQPLPVRISQPIEQLLLGINTGASTVRLIWDDRFQGLHVFITQTAGQAAATHFFWEQRTGAWWQDQFGNSAHNPLCCVVFDGNLPEDRRPLIGSWDGYVRAIDPTAVDDDGTPIASTVVLGPLLTKDLDDIILKDIQGVLGASSGSVTYQVFMGATAEVALSSTPVTSGTWGPGRNFSNLVRRSGHAIYVQLTATTPWALEGVRARIAGQGKVRRRGV
jgi:hypothetical protein